MYFKEGITVDDKKHAPLTLGIFVPTIFLAGIAILFMLLFPSEATTLINTLFNYMTNELGWMYLIVVIVLLVFSLWIAFSKFGSIKLGDEDDKKQYSDLTWTAMMFASGMSISVVLLGFAEPIALLGSPPLGIEPYSDLSYQAAHMYEQFAEGFVAWSVYGPASVAVAYTVYVKKDSVLRISNACKPVLRGNSDGVLGKGIDVLVMLGMIGGISTSLGMGTPAVMAFIEYLFGVEQSTTLTLFVLGIWGLMFGISVFLGLDKGIKNLSNINIYILGFLVLLVIFRAPVFELMSTHLASLGMMFENLGSLTLGLGPFSGDSFTEDWTIFYWAWWISFMPMMALFGAKISKGRTVRQLVLGEMIYGGMGAMFVFGLFGGYSLHLQKSGALDLVSVLNDGGNAAVVLAILETLPMPKITIFIVMILIFTFLSTTIDSTAYTLASVCSSKLKGDAQPARWNRMLWACVLLLFSLGLVFIGGLQTTQTASIVLGFPLIFVSIVIIVSVKRMFNEHENSSK